MKLNKEFILSELGDDMLLVPTGKAAVELHGVIRLNETAAFLINCLQEDVFPV